MNWCESRVTVIAFDPNGRVICGDADGRRLLWDPATGGVRALVEHESAVRAIAVSPDGRIVSGSEDHTVKYWNPATGAVQTMDQHRAEGCMRWLWRPMAGSSAAATTTRSSWTP